MSKTSIFERNKAISDAWKREQQLVKEGKGTRDWTIEQQKDILDPQKGKAYDDKGRAFDGQHMKSAAKYPEYQGNPDNIQFLTKDEHLEAHKGSWQNPTNWYYDPTTKEFTVFEENQLIPCIIIELSTPIRVIEYNDGKSCSGKDTSQDYKADEHSDSESVHGSDVGQEKFAKLRGFISKPEVADAYRFFQSVSVIGDSITSSYVNELNDYTNPVIQSPIAQNDSHDNTQPVASNRDYPETRSLPCANDVGAHRQRYHTKNGVVWKDKSGYHREGKGDDVNNKK